MIVGDNPFALIMLFSFNQFCKNSNLNNLFQSFVENNYNTFTDIEFVMLYHNIKFKLTSSEDILLFKTNQNAKIIVDEDVDFFGNERLQNKLKLTTSEYKEYIDNIKQNQLIQNNTYNVKTLTFDLQINELFKMNDLLINLIFDFVDFIINENIKEQQLPMFFKEKMIITSLTDVKTAVENNQLNHVEFFEMPIFQLVYLIK